MYSAIVDSRTTNGDHSVSNKNDLNE